MNRWNTIGLAILLVTFAESAIAQCATQMTAPPNVVVCPSGDASVQATFYDAAGNPCAFEPVTMWITPFAQSTMWFAAGQPTTINATTDALGVATFYVATGGCSQAAAAVGFYDSAGTLLASVSTVSSPDMDASGRVQLTDFTLFQAAFLTGDPCADFDADGTVGLGDYAFFQQHFLH